MFLHYLPGTAPWVRTATDVVVVLHIAGGVAGVAAGVGALTFRKGERWHRLAGTVFFVAMLTLGSTAAVIGVVLNEVGNVFGGVFVCYLVATAWMTVRRPEGAVGWFEGGAIVLAFAVAAVAGLGAARAIGAHRVGPILFASIVMAAFAIAAGAGDLSVILRRGLSGAQRVARHLWRMCLAFAMAAGAFVTQPSMFPHPMPILLAAATLPLVLMVFWLLVVGLTGRFKRARINAAPAT
jgi:uncharacterized membrane protein